MKAVYGLYPDPDSAERAVELLRGANVDDRSIVVLSSEPFDEYEFGRRDHKTIMPWLAALGGLVGGASAFAFVAFTQKVYPLPTGGMPIVSLWPNGKILIGVVNPAEGLRGAAEQALRNAGAESVVSRQ